MEGERLDLTDALYRPARPRRGPIMGMARLPPTLRPSLLGGVFSQRAGAEALPREAQAGVVPFAAFDPVPVDARQAPNRQ
jgi:N-acyl-L-homoserine lactone synthetase